MTNHHHNRLNHSVTTRIKALITLTSLSLLAFGGCALKKSADKSPKEKSEMYSNIGTEALLRGDHAQAVEDLRKAVQLDDRNAIAHNHLGLAYFAYGKREDAKRELERAIALDPTYSDAYINLANLVVENNEFTLGRELYNKALSNLEYKNRHRALTNLAQLELKQGHHDRARMFLYQSLQANEEYCLTHFLLGTVYMRDNEPARAADSFRKSVKSTCTTNVDGHMQLGIAYMKAKQYDKAKNAFSLLIDQFPETAQAKEAKEQLRVIP